MNIDYKLAPNVETKYRIHRRKHYPIIANYDVAAPNSQMLEQQTLNTELKLMLHQA